MKITGSRLTGGSPSGDGTVGARLVRSRVSRKAQRLNVRTETNSSAVLRLDTDECDVVVQMYIRTELFMEEQAIHRELFLLHVLILHIQTRMAIIHQVRIDNK